MNFITSKSKPISKILLCTPRTLHLSLFSTSSSSSSLSPRRRDEEESRGVRVSVWWDIENCQVPNGVNVFKIAHSITSAVRSNGIKGPVQITGFGDIFCLTRANQEALSCTGVNLIHVPHGGKNSADRSLLVDLMYWVSQNPPPAHIFLISGDRDFAGILHRLRMSNYNILLAGREGKYTPGVLCSAASIMWHWNELAKGESLSGRHFNQPPDGPFNSWYGHYRGPLEDPYALPEHQICCPPASPQADDSSNAEPSVDPRRRPVPVAVVRQLKRIIGSNPNGLTITELRGHLANSKVTIDKGFYGYKKFSRFLLSMPHIVKVESCSDGQFFLRPVPPKLKVPVESYDVSPESMATVNGDRDIQGFTKANGETTTITRMVDPKPLISVSPIPGKDRTVEEKKIEETFEKSLDAPLREDQVASTNVHNGKEASDAQVVDSPLLSVCPEAPIVVYNPEQKMGLFKRLWTKLFRRSIAAETTSHHIPDESNTSTASAEVPITEEESSKPSEENDVDGPAHSSSDTAINLDAKSDRIDKSEVSPGFIAKVIGWCKSWRISSSINTPTEQSSEQSRLEDENSKMSDGALPSRKFSDDPPHSRRHELFSKDTFWNALRSFLKTSKGSDLVMNSASREQLAERLQKEGPLVLRPFQSSDIHHLVDLLVSEKKWIKEFPAKSPRFRLIHPPGENSASAQPHNSNGLRSIFLNSSSPVNPQLRVSSVVHKKTSERSRSEILADCQKLLDELFSKYPEGLNMSCFKKDFLDKYGYALDHQKLGYPKLASLLQIMPGVKVESVHILPDSVVYAPGIESLGLKEKSAGSDSEMSDTPRKDEDVESQWEELGPVANLNLSKQEAKSSVNGLNGGYEPAMSDDDEFSDTEEDKSSSSHTKSRSMVDEEDSSLLQILDSWYSTKDESSPTDPASGPEVSGDSSDDETRRSGSSRVSVKGKGGSAVNHTWKQRPVKNYRFVSEPGEPKKDKLIDGILGSLKKSGESKIPG